MKKLLVGILILTAGLFLLSTPSSFAQDACEGDFDGDNDVDGSDAATLKEDFGRSPFSNPCPEFNPCPYNMIDCGTKCVDPLTDEDFCGADLSCLGGVVCGVSEKCISGTCEIMGDIVYQAAVPKTGQTSCYDEAGATISCTGTGQDGEYQKGVPWPNPRFRDNGDGTVRDNLTGLIWLKNANCFGLQSWYWALRRSNDLNDGECGLTDGSSRGDWRLPNRKELASLIHKGHTMPAVPNTAGTGRWSEGDPFSNLYHLYWSSNTCRSIKYRGWLVDLADGYVSTPPKSATFYVWPVRDPL